MPRDDKIKLGARDKVVQKMTRDGAELKNLSEGSSERISSRLSEGSLDKKSERDPEFGGRGRKTQSPLNRIKGTQSDKEDSAPKKRRKQSDAIKKGNEIGNASFREAGENKTIHSSEMQSHIVIPPAPSSYPENPADDNVDERFADLLAEENSIPTIKADVKNAAGDKARNRLRERHKTRLKTREGPRLKELEKATGIKADGKVDKPDVKKEKPHGNAKYVLSNAVHGKIDEETDDNTAVEAAHRSEEAVEYVLHKESDKARKRQLRNRSVRADNVSRETTGKGRFSEEKLSKEKAVKQDSRQGQVVSKAEKGSGKKNTSKLRHEEPSGRHNDPDPVIKAEHSLNPKGEKNESKISQRKASKLCVQKNVGKPSSLQETKTVDKPVRLYFDSKTHMPVTTAGTVRGVSYKKERIKTSRLRFYAEERNSEVGRINIGKRNNPTEITGTQSTSKGKEVQKKQLKREYASAYRNKRRGRRNGHKPGGGSTNAAQYAVSEKEKEAVKTFFSEHKATILIAMFFFLVLVIMLTSVGTVATAIMSGGESFAQSTYLSSDNEITSTNDTYAAMEDALQNKIDRIPQDHPGYDEYRYDLDDLNYDPYVLTSYLTAKYKEYALSDVQAELQSLFDAQYTLTLTPITETRYDSEGNPYSWCVLKATLRNNNLGNVVATRMDEDQKKAYDLYQETLGNRSYLFAGGGAGGNGTAPAGLDYAPTDEALLDSRFAGMIHEAEKYLGYPYVWGGSTPSTSFDCSGFVSWVINNSGNGWNVGRQTANGLLGCTARVTEPKAGDLIFFQGTYDTAGASHVAIVVDPEQKIMIHAGKPIQYASYDTAYWNQHFMCYGRLP